MPKKVKKPTLRIRIWQYRRQWRWRARDSTPEFGAIRSAPWPTREKALGHADWSARFAGFDGVYVAELRGHDKERP